MSVDETFISAGLEYSHGQRSDSPRIFSSSSGRVNQTIESHPSAAPARQFTTTVITSSALRSDCESRSKYT